MSVDKAGMPGTLYVISDILHFDAFVTKAFMTV